MNSCLSKPPPSFNKPDQWSSQFIDFVTLCLVKNPEERATASQLLQHEFIRNQARQPEILADFIREAQDMREKLAENAVSSSDDTSGNTGTMLPDSNQTLVRNSGDTTGGGTDNGTMIQHRTLVPEMQPRTMTDLESDLGTMVINENYDDEDDDTMKRHDSKDYRPAFLDHFEKKDRQDNSNSDAKCEKPPPGASAGPAVAQEVKASTSAAAANPALQRQLEQIAGGQPVVGGPAGAAPSTSASSQEPSSQAAENNAAMILQPSFSFRSSP